MPDVELLDDITPPETESEPDPCDLKRWLDDGGPPPVVDTP